MLLYVRSYSDSVVRQLVVLDILTNTRDYWLITCVQYCTVYESMWRRGRGSAPNPARELTAPSRVQTSVKHTSLHNRLGALKCSKTHLQQSIISKIFRGTNLRTPATGSALEHNEQGRQLSNAGPEPDVVGTALSFTAVLF